jgi:SAM-dependent methyltransferase
VSTSIHPAARRGFGTSTSTYERGRPSYPPEAVAFLIDRLGLDSTRSLVELGPGTGKLTSLLVSTGARLIGVEPVAAMRRALTARLPEVEALDARAEELPLENGSVDAAVAAQSFHWFEGDHALAELARVMRSAAMLAVVFNVRDDSVPWVRELVELQEPYRGDAPSHRSMRWREAFDRTMAFTTRGVRSFRHEHESTSVGVADRVLSISFIAALDPDRRSQIAEDVHRILAADPATRGRDPILTPYRTDCYLWERVERV